MCYCKIDDMKLLRNIKCIKNAYAFALMANFMPCQSYAHKLIDLMPSENTNKRAERERRMRGRETENSSCPAAIRP